MKIAAADLRARAPEAGPGSRQGQGTRHQQQPRRSGSPQCHRQDRLLLQPDGQGSAGHGPQGRRGCPVAPGHTRAGGHNLTDTKLLARITLIETDSLSPRGNGELDDRRRGREGRVRDAAPPRCQGQGADDTCRLRRKGWTQRHGPTCYFDIPRGEETAFQRELSNAGETLSRKVTRQPDNVNVTDAKVGYQWRSRRPRVFRRARRRS